MADDHQSNTWLIDAVVQQTMVLIAQIATRGGQRAQLAHVANGMFLELVEALEKSGVNQKVIADMFGMALRTYQRRRQRLLASRSEENRTVWEALLTYIDEHGPVTRRAVLDRFRWDEESIVRGVLADLVESDLVYRSGVGNAARYRLVEGEAVTGEDPVAVAAGHVWLAIYREGPVTRDALAAQARFPDEVLDDALAQLVEDGRVEHDDEGYNCARYLIPYGARAGWSAAVFDHYQAMVGALGAKLRGDTVADARDAIGGSTFSLSVWRGHPFEAEALSLLSELRERVHAFRTRIDRYNADHPADGTERRVVVYLGQSVIDAEEE